MLSDLHSYYCYGKDILWQQQLWHQAPSIGVACFFWLYCRRQSALGVALRIAFALPLVHILLLGLGAGIWIRTAASDNYLAAHLSVLDCLPTIAWVLCAAVTSFIGLMVYGAVTEGRRQPVRLYPVSIGLLLFTLLFGLWMPIVLSYAIPFNLPNWHHEALAFRERFLWICPPGVPS